MAIAALRRLAATAPVPVFAAVGAHASDRVADLFVSGELARVASPRHAAILLIAGRVRPDDYKALRQLHDQVPQPRVTVCWGDQALPGFEDAEHVLWQTDPVPTLRTLYRALMGGKRLSEPDRLPDEPPAPWRGLGEHGQGGKGMMGGTPYGRPMAMTADDSRDGLALDAFTLTLGPFFPVLPAGLVLDLTLQGDLIEQAKIVRPPLAEADPHTLCEGSMPRVLATRRLRWIARLLEVLELRAWAWRAASLAKQAESGRGVSLVPLRHCVRRCGVYAAIPKGLGAFDGTDVRGRLKRWLDEAEHALVGGTSDASANGPVAVLRADLEKLLRGREWNEAMLVLASFAPDAMREGFESSHAETSST